MAGLSGMKKILCKISLVLILTIFILLTLVKLNAAKTVAYEDITHSALTNQIIGENPSVEIELKEKTKLRDVWISIYGINEYGLENYIYWRTAEEEYTDERSMLYSTPNYGEEYKIHIDRDDSVKFIKLSPNYEKGNHFGIILVSTISEDMRVLLYFFAGLLTMIIVLVLISILSNVKFPKRIEKHPTLLFILVFTITTIILFYKYLFGGYYYIFRDVSSDTYNQMLPGFINQLNRFESFGYGSGWNQYVGLGMEQNSYFPTFINWYLLLGKNAVFYCFGLNAVIKIILAGIFAYLYAGEFTKNNTIKWIAGFGYAFSGAMIIRSPWETYGVIVMLSMLWLLLFEKSKKKNNYSGLCLGTILFFMSMHSYDAILYIGIFGLYILFRSLEDGQIQLKQWFKTELVFGCFAILSSLDILIFQLSGMLGSKRFSEKIDYNLFPSAKELISAFCRTIGMDIQGITMYYSQVGNWNFLEDPTFYCGLIMIITIPACFAVKDGRRKRGMIALYMLVAAYVIFTPVRYILNGRAGLTWKLSSLWIIFVILYFFIRKGEYIFDRRKSVFIILNSTSAVLIALITYIYFRELYVNGLSLTLSALFIISYTVLYDLYSFNKLDKCILGYTIKTLVVVEAVLFSLNIVNNRYVLTSNDIDNGKGYYDETASIVKELSKNDDPELFRIDKQFFSTAWCDSLFQNYMDSEAYVGREGIGNDVYNILDYFELPKSANNHLMYGSGPNNYFDSMVGTKYILSRNTDIANYGYTFKKKYGNINVFVNEYALPFAYTYDKAYGMTSFEALNAYERSMAIMENCFIDSDDLDAYEYKVESSALTELIYSQEGIAYYPLANEGVGIRLDVDYDNLQDDRVSVLFFSGPSGIINTYYIKIPKGVSHASYEIVQPGITAIWIDADSSSCITQARLYEMSDEYFSYYKEAALNRQNHALNISYKDENNIVGDIECGNEEYLFVSIPYNSKWHIEVDGTEQEVLKINGGFIGTKLGVGKHDVRIWFETHTWLERNIFKLMGIFLCACIITYELYAKRRRSL